DFAAQRVHHGDAYTVQTAGYRVSAAAKLASRVKDRHDDFNRGLAFGGVHVHGNSATVIGGPYPAVGEQSHGDGVAVARESLIHRVVDDFVDEVVEAPLSGRADVHSGALAHCL